MIRIVQLLLVLIFAASSYFVFEFGSGPTHPDNAFVRTGYVGGAIGFALIASAALLGFVYLLCNYKSTQAKGNNTDLRSHE